MMNNNVAILVGDRFNNFARNREVFCVSDFMATTRLGAAVEPHLFVGQGLSRENVDELVSVLQARNLPCAIQIQQPASKETTHKAIPHNIMISEPRRLDIETFEVDLLLDERSAEISDHQTGQHIQGLALVEAARQTWTAVLETYLLAHDRPTRFVLEEINSRFEGFVFPLPALLRLKILEARTSASQSIYCVSVTVEQTGRQAAEITGKFRVVDERINDRQEMIAARTAVEAFLADADHSVKETV